ncbi:MAG: glycosyltransferase family 39 protein [Chloroflexi bacterium]|nr:glycosyltransferase family 39 protein [Chloroflexota bacterium]
MSRHQRLVLALAVALLLLAVWARFDRIGVQSLWNDEGNSYGQSLRTLPDITINAAADIHPPGYYVLLAVWRILTGESEFALRALSAFASLLGAAFAFALGKRLYGDAAGLTALAIVGVNTFSIMYAQEARMYALLALLGAASTWALVDLILSPGRRGTILLAATTAAGLYTNYAYAGLLAAQAAFGLLWLAGSMIDRRTTLPVIKAVALGYGAALLLYLPWLPTALRQVTQWGSTGEPIGAGDALPVALGWLTVGPTFTVTGVPVALVLLMALGLYNLKAPLRHERRRLRDSRLSHTRQSRNPKSLAVLTVAGETAPRKTAAIPRALALTLPPLWVGVTLGGFLALGLFREANLKFLLPAQIAVALWIGRGAWVLWHLPLRHTRRWTPLVTRVTAVLMVAAIVFGARNGLAALHNDPEFQRDDYKGIAQAIAEDGQPDAAVILNAPGQIEVFEYYARRYGPGWTLAALPIGLTVDAAATENALDALLSTHKRVYAVLWGTDERDPDQLVERILNTRAYPIDENWYGSVRLARYVTPGKLGHSIPSGALFDFPGGELELVDYALSSTVLTEGGSLEIALNWRVDMPPVQDYKITVQLLDQDGTLIVQRDAEPVGYQRPTSTWAPDEIIHDRHALLIPNALPAPQYRLIVGVYASVSPSERLPVAGNDALTLAEFNLQDAGD